MEISGQKTQKMTTKEFAAKFRSKNEIYAFMSVDVGAYLPPKEVCTIYFLKDLVTQKRKCKQYTFF